MKLDISIAIGAEIRITLSILAFAYSSINASDLTYGKLAKDGIVSGFGVQHGDPLALINRITPIDRPDYVKAKNGLYEGEELCIGTFTKEGWRFSPIFILNYHEIHGKTVTIHYDPEYKWARAYEENGQNLNCAYSYMFAMYHHLPKIPIFQPEN